MLVISPVLSLYKCVQVTDEQNLILVHLCENRDDKYNSDMINKFINI